MDRGFYAEAELAKAPEVALNLSRGCGNPTGFADLAPGEIVVDFGCGGGLDVVLAAGKVGQGGKVVGVDFAPEMIKRARQAVTEAGFKDRDIQLLVADLGGSGLAEGFADVVISNCVINLCPDMKAVYEEAFRILRPGGGRIAISDIVYTDDIDSQLRERFQSTWSGCLGGAAPEQECFRIVRDTGFSEVNIVSRHVLTSRELLAMATCPGEEFTPAPAGEDLLQVQGRVASVKFTALKG